jgi:hypothetical protein
MMLNRLAAYLPQLTTWGSAALQSGAVISFLVLIAGGAIAFMMVRDCDHSMSRLWRLGCADPDVAIFVQSPEVYTRARLLNDRNDQKNWLTDQLKSTKETEKFVTREEDARRSINESLKIQLQMKGRDAAPNDSPQVLQNSNQTGNAGSAGQGTDKSILERRPSSLLFKAINEHRDEIRSELSRIQLDDRHDIGGNTAYTLRFPTSIIGDFSAGHRGVLLVRAKLPPITLDKVEPALESWRSSVQSVYSSSLRDSAFSLSSSGDQSLEDLGLSSSDFREYVVQKLLCGHLEEFCPPHERNLHKEQDPNTRTMATRDGRSLMPEYENPDNEWAKTRRQEIEAAASEIRNFLPRYLQKIDDLNALVEEWAYYKRRNALVVDRGNKASPPFAAALAQCFISPEIGALPDTRKLPPDYPRNVISSNEFQVKYLYGLEGKDQDREWKVQHPCTRTDRSATWIAKAIFNLVEAHNFGDRLREREVGPQIPLKETVRLLTVALDKKTKSCRTNLTSEIERDSGTLPDRTPGRLPELCKSLVSAPADIAPPEPELRRISNERWATARLQELRCAMADFRAYQATWRRYLSPDGQQISFSDFFDIIAVRYGNQGCDLEVRVKFRGNRFKDSKVEDCSRQPSSEIGTPYVQALCRLMRELEHHHTLFALGLTPAILRTNVNNKEDQTRKVDGHADTGGNLGAMSFDTARMNSRVSKDSVATVVSFVPHKPKPAIGSSAVVPSVAEKSKSTPVSSAAASSVPNKPKPAVDSSATAFGWMFLPDASSLGARQFDLTATLAVPGWVTELDVTVQSCFGTPQELSGVVYDLGGATGNQCKEAWVGQVRLPGEPAEITRKLNLEVFNVPHLKVIPGINDFNAAGVVLRAGHPGSLLIPGRRLWKNTYVSLGEQLADEISILPDMEGIVARFKCVHVPSEIIRSMGQPGPGDDSGSADPLPARKLARVWTSEGVTVPITVTIEQFGPLKLCEAQDAPQVTKPKQDTTGSQQQQKQEQQQQKQQQQQQQQSAAGQ